MSSISLSILLTELLAISELLLFLKNKLVSFTIFFTVIDKIVFEEQMSEPTCWDTRGWMHLKSRLTSRTRLMVYLREDVFVKQVDQLDKFNEISEDVFVKQIDQLDKFDEIPEDLFFKQIDQIDKFDEIPEDVFEKQVDQLDKAEEIIDDVQGVQ